MGPTKKTSHCNSWALFLIQKRRLKIKKFFKLQKLIIMVTRLNGDLLNHAWSVLSRISQNFFWQILLDCIHLAVFPISSTSLISNPNQTRNVPSSKLFSKSASSSYGFVVFKSPRRIVPNAAFWLNWEVEPFDFRIWTIVATVSELIEFV